MRADIVLRLMLLIRLTAVCIHQWYRVLPRFIILYHICTLPCFLGLSC